MANAEPMPGKPAEPEPIVRWRGQAAAATVSSMGATAAPKSPTASGAAASLLLLSALARKPGGGQELANPSHGPVVDEAPKGVVREGRSTDEAPYALSCAQDARCVRPVGRLLGLLVSSRRTTLAPSSFSTAQQPPPGQRLQPR